MSINAYNNSNSLGFYNNRYNFQSQQGFQQELPPLPPMMYGQNGRIDNIRGLGLQSLDFNGQNGWNQGYGQNLPPMPPMAGWQEQGQRGFGLDGQRADMLQVFVDADTDESGGISQSEFENMEGPPGAPELSDDRKSEMWSRLDSNSDGSVTAKEFAKGRPSGNNRFNDYRFNGYNY